MGGIKDVFGDVFNAKVAAVRAQDAHNQLKLEGAARNAGIGGSSTLGGGYRYDPRADTWSGGVNPYIDEYNAKVLAAQQKLADEERRQKEKREQIRKNALYSMPLHGLKNLWKIKFKGEVVFEDELDADGRIMLDRLYRAGVLEQVHDRPHVAYIILANESEG